MDAPSRHHSWFVQFNPQRPQSWAMNYDNQTKAAETVFYISVIELLTYLVFPTLV